MHNRTIQDIIQTQRLISCTPEETVLQAVYKMNESDVGAVVVLDGVQTLKGILTESDVLKRVLGKDRDPRGTLLEEVMSTNLVTVRVDRTLMYGFCLMLERGCRHIPVLDSVKVVGLLSLRDIMSIDLAQLEDMLRRKEDLTESIGFGG